jgi:hypothetical protein
MLCQICFVLEKNIVVILCDITWTEQIVKSVVHVACIQEIPGVNFDVPPAVHFLFLLKVPCILFIVMAVFMHRFVPDRSHIH